MSVIIPVYRDWRRLELCLDALERQNFGRDDFEIIIVNNEPQAAPDAELPDNARIIHEPRAGSYAARNTGVRAAVGRILAFTDSDCVPDQAWLSRGLEVLEQNSGARATGPIAIFREPGTSYLAYAYEKRGALNQRTYLSRGFCATANLLVSREVFERVGHFNESRYSGGDREWGNRALRAGVPIIYDERIRILHPARRTVGQVLKRKRRFAGAAAQEPNNSTRQYVRSRLKRISRRGVETDSASRPDTRRETLAFLFVAWLVRLSEIVEFLLVRWGAKGPNRG